MSLTCRAVAAERGLDVALELASGQTLALIGPNGAGKSSVLSILGGLLTPDEGTAVLDGRCLFEFHGGRRHEFLPPHRRRLSLLTQDPLLFTRMDVLDNVAFAPRCRGQRRAESRRTGLVWLERVGGAGLHRQRAGELSGGQAQRVALARALAAEPSLLLLDEPLSALDVAAAADLRHILRTLLAGRTTILVTHDLLDAVLLADQVAVIEQGRIVESGPAGLVMARPRSTFAAGFFGWNLIRGRALGPDALTAADGSTILGEAEASLGGGEAVAVFRPSAVSVHLRPPEGSPRNTFTGRVTALEPLGHLVRVRVGGLSADVTPGSVTELGLGPGVDVHLAVKAAEVSLYPA